MTSELTCLAGGVRQPPRSLLLGEHEVSLANVDTVHQLLSSGGKTRPLTPSTTVAGKLKGIQIRCKVGSLLAC